jgi:hypothetical protein
MPMIMPSDVTNEVLAVLQAADPGKGAAPQYLTAYQILQRLEPPLRDQLIAERGLPGKGAGIKYSAAQVVSDAAEMLERRGQVQIEYMDNENVLFEVGGNTVSGGYAVCGLYRLRR